MNQTQRDELLVRIDQQVKTLNEEVLKTREHIGNLYAEISNVKPQIESHSTAIKWISGVGGAMMAGLAGWMGLK